MSPGKTDIVEVPLRCGGRPLSLLVKPRTDTGVSGTIAASGIWEPYNTALLQALLREGDVFVDAGAHIGYFSVLAAERVGPSGRVVVFEPEPDNFALCVENLRRNGLAERGHLHRCALGEREEVRRMFRAESNHGAHQLDHPCFGGVDREGIDVEVVSFDHVARQTPGLDRVDCMKLDLQGYEMKALRGMRETIRRNRDHLVMLVEFGPALLERFDAEGAGVEAFLRFLAEETEMVCLIQRRPTEQGGAALSAVTADQLAEMSDSLLRESASVGPDPCVDLLLVFSEMGRRALLSKAGRRERR